MKKVHRFFLLYLAHVLQIHYKAVEYPVILGVRPNFFYLFEIHLSYIRFHLLVG